MTSIREAVLEDIKDIQIIRNAVKENTLSDPALISDEDVLKFMTIHGKGWVSTKDEQITGFAIVDLTNNNIWALFVHPDEEGNGAGKQLHKKMLDWYFSKTNDDCWLSTTPGTRAEKFYQMQGWTRDGLYGKDEIKFIMTQSVWNNN